MITLDGFSSTSRDETVARSFATNSDTSGDKQLVLLKIHMENETGKHFFCLDSIEFSLYPSE